MLQVSHCRDCAGAGREVIEGKYFICQTCGGTGHIVEVVQEEVHNTTPSVPPKNLVYHDHCFMYNEEGCEKDPCNDCDLANVREAE